LSYGAAILYLRNRSFYDIRVLFATWRH
jgi:hypothetical protein